MLDKAIDVIRITLYALIVVVVLLLFQAWQQDHPKLVQTDSQTTQAQSDRYVPAAETKTNDIQREDIGSVKPPSAVGKLVNVKTDVLSVVIDTQGGDILESTLIKYPESLGASAPYVLLTNDPKTRYIAESGLLGVDGPDTSADQAIYVPEQPSYEMKAGQQNVQVKMTWNKRNIFITKTFIFTRGSYEIKVRYDIDNRSNFTWDGNLYTQLARTNTPPVNHSGMMNLATYFGAAISTPQKPFEKITFKQMQERNLDALVQNGWAAMIQHYFVSAWIPPISSLSNYYSRVTSNGLYTIGMIGRTLSVDPGKKNTIEASFYTGPALAEHLEKAAPGLQLTIDYGWFWFISVSIFWMMQKIYDVIGNWGWSIVLVTVIIKLLFYQLSAKSYRSMSTLKRLQPRIEALKERYGDDRQKMTQATMDLYRQEKVNPMSGCLPILIQIPVFIALYWVLVESVQLRQAPFMFWIHDLSQRDPYYVLPILMGISMFIQQRMNPPPPDPMQAKIMMMMPVVFTVLFANFPAGLMLYWFVNNTLSFAQQWFIMHQLDKELAARQG